AVLVVPDRPGERPVAPANRALAEAELVADPLTGRVECKPPVGGHIDYWVANPPVGRALRRAGPTCRLGALVARPEVLFAREPTGALDSLTGQHVMDLLVAAARDEGTTVVLVTHEARVAAYADREVIVRDGRVTSLVPAAISS